MSKQKTLKSYLLSKCLIGDGLFNGIFNFIIFYLMEKGAEEPFTRADAMINLAITFILLGYILTLCVYPLTKMDLKKGAFSTEGNNTKVANMLPNNKHLAGLVIGLIATIICMPIFYVVSLAISFPLTVMQMGIFKGIACAVAGGVSGYFAIVKIVQQHNDAA